MILPVKLFGLIPLDIEVDVTYTDDMAPNTGAYALGRFKVFVRPKYKDDDKGIHEHEFLHIKQAWANPWHGLMYKHLDWYRLKCEVACYREQAKHYPDDRRPLFAEFIARDYGLSVSKEEVLRRLCE